MLCGADVSFRLEAGMTGTEVLDSTRDAIMTVVMISAPLLIVATMVGVAVSLFQALIPAVIEIDRRVPNLASRLK